MTYELALELKNAGFPQKASLANMVDSAISAPNYGDEYAYTPTLEELIEACGAWRHGDKNVSPFSSIAGQAIEFNLHATLENGVLTWCAGYAYPGHYDEADILKTGSTPSEAVARLWFESKGLPKHEPTI